MNIQRLQSLLTEAANNPQRAAALAKDALSELRPKVLAEMEISGIVVVPGFSSIAAPGAGAVTEGDKVNIEWPGGRGQVVSIFAGTLDGADATLDKVGLRLSVNGEHELMTDSTKYAFARLKGIQSRTSSNWLRLRDTTVTSSQKWVAQFANFDVGGAAYTPYLMFGYVNLNGGR